MLAGYMILCAFMVSVDDIPILVHYSPEVCPSLEEQFLQCLVEAIFSLVLFSSFSFVPVHGLLQPFFFFPFSENSFYIFKTSVAMTADYLENF